MITETDEQLLDRSAHRELHHRHARRAAAFVAKKLGVSVADPQVAEIVNKAFERVFKAAEKTNIVCFKAYLFTALRYGVYDAICRNRDNLEPLSEDHAACSPAPLKGVVDPMDKDELVRRLRPMIERIPDPSPDESSVPKRHRKAAFIMWLLQVPASEIAGILQITKEEVHNAVTLAKKFVRKEYEANYGKY